MTAHVTFDLHGRFAQEAEKQAASRERFLEDSLGPLRRVKRIRALGRLFFGCELAWHRWSVFEQTDYIGDPRYKIERFWLECVRCHVKIHPPEGLQG